MSKLLLEDDLGLMEEKPIAKSEQVGLEDDLGILGTFEPEKPSFLKYLMRLGQKDEISKKEEIQPVNEPPRIAPFDIAQSRRIWGEAESLSEEVRPEGIKPPEKLEEKKTIPELRALPEDTIIRNLTPEEKQADFDFAVNRMADQIFTASTGLTPEQGIIGQKKLSQVMGRSMQVAMALGGAPILALGYEALNQAKNAIVTAVKEEKYSPVEIRMLSELIPDDVNNVIKIGATVSENLVDIALIGGLYRSATEGTLKSTLAELGKKLEKAGYGTGKKTINLDVVKEYSKGTTLEAEANRWLKVKQAQIKPKVQIGAPGVTPTPQTPVPTEPQQAIVKAFPEASKQGTVIGIDANTKLPIIDTTKPAEQPLEAPVSEVKPVTPATPAEAPETPPSEIPQGKQGIVEGLTIGGVKKELKNIGAEIIGDKVKLYRGGDVSKSELKKLRYNDYLSLVKEGTDATGNEGASAYGKNVIEIELPIKDIKITNGEIQYIGKSESLKGGTKYPPEIYKAYNDVYGSNYTAKEIDAQDNVRSVASQGLSGGREEFDSLVSAQQGKGEIEKKYYHGSSSEVVELEPSKPRNAPGNMEGIYLTTDKETAKEYGKNVSEVEVNLEKPFIGDPNEYVAKKYGVETPTFGSNKEIFEAYNKVVNPENVKKILLSEGYDGVIRDTYEGGETIVFDSSKVKIAQQGKGEIAPTPTEGKVAPKEGGGIEEIKTLKEVGKALPEDIAEVKEEMKGYRRTDFKKGSTSEYPSWWTTAGEELGEPLRKSDFYGRSATEKSRAQKGIFARLEAGEKLTENQQAKLDVLMKHYRDAVNKLEGEIENAKSDLSESEAREVVAAFEKEKQIEYDWEGNVIEKLTSKGMAPTEIVEIKGTPKKELEPKLKRKIEQYGMGGGKVTRFEEETPTGTPAKGEGYGIIEPSEKSAREPQAKTDYSQIEESLPSQEKTNLIKESLKIIAPANVSEASRATSQILRKGLADLAHRDVVAMEALKKAHSAFTWMSKEDAYGFEHRVELGEPQENSKLQPFADTMRKLLDERRVEVQNLGKGHLESFIENYFPHIWKDPAKAKDVMAQIMGKKRLEGTKSFLKRRLIPTIKEGVERGLEPVSDNPVDLVLLKLHEMDRYIMAQHIIQDMKARRLVKFVYSRSKPPDGYSKINDHAFTVYMPPEITKKDYYDIQLVEQMMDIARSLGIDTRRFVSIGGKRAGYAQWSPGQIGGEKVRTKFASPESVLAHEIGHVLGYRYNLYEVLGRRLEGETKVHQRGKEAGKEYFKPTPEAVDWRRIIDPQWRALADARQQMPAYARNYREKEAVMLEASIHAPKVFQKVAPDLYRAFTDFLNMHSELRPLLDIEPSLTLGANEAKIKVPGFTTLGHYYAPDDVARLINNHLSPGLRNSQNKLISGSYNILRGAGNLLNQVNLSLSLFHAINVSTDMMASTLGLGLRKLMTRGQLSSGIKDVVSFPISPFVNIWEGMRIKKAYKKQIDQITDPKLRGMVETIIAAGGRDRMDVFYYNNQIKALENTFSQIIKEKDMAQLLAIVKLPFHIFGATMEVLAKPLMEWYVPTGKIGLFSKLAQHEMMRAEAGEITDEQLVDRLCSVWDSVDNRMGQLIYDNLFWHKAMKDSLMMMIRSVGWNLGSWREYAGATVDIVTMNSRMKRGDKFFSQKMSYVAGAAVVYSILGAMITYLLTGEKPKEPKDYFFPRTGMKNPDGSDERLSLPTYAKDIYSYSQRPIETLKNKGHPLIGLLNEQISNKDFFNIEIAPLDDPLFEQIINRAKHIINYSKPFSFKNYEKMQKTGGTSGQNWFVSITGITSAPSYVTRSAAQKLMYRYISEKIPDSTRTKEQYERGEYRKALKSMLRKGQPINHNEAREILGEDSYRKTLRGAELSPFADSFMRLNLEEALNVYALATQEEKKQTLDILNAKYKNAKIKTPEIMDMYGELINAKEK